MNSKRQFVLGLLVALLAFQLACHKKQAVKSKLPGPAEAPTLTQTLPDEIQPQPMPEKPTETAKAQEPPPLPKKTKTRKKGAASQAKTAQPPAPTAAAQTATPATTAELHPPPSPANSAAEVAIGPDITSAEAARDRESTTHLLDTTENELKRVDSSNLSSDQQAMLTQIRTYISQSRKAITEGDYERASNLAKKAQVLTDELMKK
jgi:outer membrane biosynthesis protein TonB